MNASTAIVFDLDGTLVDTLRDIGEAMNRSLAAEGFPEQPLEFYPTAIGDGMAKLLKRCLRPHTMDPAREHDMLIRFKEDYAENLLNHSRLYTGIRELLDLLEVEDIPKAILSNKPDALTRVMVQELMGDWPFKAVQGQLEGIPHKPDAGTTLSFLQGCRFRPETTYMVGDSRTDMMTATAAGMIPIGVSWGFRTERELLDHGAQTILHEPKQLMEFVCPPGHRP
jgi:phosphoglycolate phosphatase